MEDERRDRTLWVGNLHPRVTEDLLYELFLQAGPLDDVKIPKDNTGKNKNFAFVTFTHAVSVGYTLALMEGVNLYGRKLNIQPRPNAAVDNTYIDMMNNHYAYMRSLRAQAGHYSEAQGSTYRPEANLTGRPDEARAYVPRMTWPPKPSEWPPRPPPTPSQAPMSTRDHHFNHGRSRDFPGNSCDRSGDRFGAFDYHGRDARGFRAGKDQPGMQSRYRDAPGLDRRFQEPRSYRDYGAPRGSREEMGHRTQEYSVRKRRY
ncbi:uncharacterized protein LOC144148078 [Haemaphysalis longicornis]|uniref:RRM domain-containing protein n=1 Tax=Haemaphysalis longicornis TaxID=44386 RepID=A0A9J6FIC7_HAELO|nr:hypothetical protein HPB48_015227 [Haemaphysalis longicornis]